MCKHENIKSLWSYNVDFGDGSSWFRNVVTDEFVDDEAPDEEWKRVCKCRLFACKSCKKVDTSIYFCKFGSKFVDNTVIH